MHSQSKPQQVVLFEKTNGKGYIGKQSQSFSKPHRFFLIRARKKEKWVSPSDNFCKLIGILGKTESKSR